MQSISGSRFKKLSPTSPLSRFLSKYDGPTRSGFITRLDRSPVKAKITTFLLSLLLNILISLFLLTVCLLSLSRCLDTRLPPQAVMSLWLTQNALVAGAAAVLARTTIVPFFLGECRLRMRHGFRGTEVVIQRLSTSTTTSTSGNITTTTAAGSEKTTLPLPLFHSRTQKAGASSSSSFSSEDARLLQHWRTALHAIHPARCYAAFSALLSPEYWMHEHTMMLDARARIAAGEIGEDELEFAIFKQTVPGHGHEWGRENGSGNGNGDGSEWSVCELWRVHEIMSDQQEVAAFERFLTQKGKEELVAVWRGMLQAPAPAYAPAPSPSTSTSTSTSASTSTMEKPSTSTTYHAIVDRFAQEGLDYETVWSQVSEETWRAARSSSSS